MQKDPVRIRLLELERFLRELRDLKKYSYEEVQESLEKEWGIERGLQLCIQLVIDAGNHILASIGESRVDKYSDILQRLGERKIISKELAKKLVPMAKMRNILVHQYLEIDPAIVYDVLQNHLDDFTEFTREILKYLEKQ